MKIHHFLSALYIILTFEFNFNSCAEVCTIRTQICVNKEDFGFLEVDDVRVSSWSCNHETEIYHVAFVSPSGKYKVLENVVVGEIYIEQFFHRFQETPYGCYFVMVSSGKGSSQFQTSIQERHLYETVKSLIQDLHVTLEGATDSRRIHVAEDPANNIDKDYTTCRDTATGLEYTGSMATTETGKVCQYWAEQTPNTHTNTPSNKPHYHLEKNYCRNPTDDPSGPWCYLSDREGVGFCDIPICPRNFKEEGVMIIARKGLQYSHESTVKLITAATGARTVDYLFDKVDTFCTEPLGTLDRLSIDPSLYGLNDKSSHDMQMGNRKLHLITSEPIMCHDAIIGWEFIAANPNTDTVLTVMRNSEAHLTLTQVGSTALTITPEMVSSNNEPSYVCIRDAPIENIEPWDVFGFYTSNYIVDHLAPFKRVYPDSTTQWKYPCSVQKTFASAGVAKIFNFTSADFPENMVEVSYQGFHLVPMNIALKPILDKGFMYQCGCADDSDCTQYGDRFMTCDQESLMCTCPQDYVYHRKSNKCIYTKSASSNQSVSYQSSHHRYDESRFGPKYAIDSNVSTDVFAGTFSCTMKQTNPWFVVDMGREMEVHGVNILTPEPIKEYTELWDKKSKFEKKMSPSAVLYGHFYGDVKKDLGLQSVQVIVLHGAITWSIMSSFSSGEHILNPRGLAGRHVYMFDSNDINKNMGPVREDVNIMTRIHNAGYLLSPDSRSCVSRDPQDTNAGFFLTPLDEGQSCVDLPQAIPFMVGVQKSGGKSFFFLSILPNKHYLTVKMADQLVKSSSTKNTFKMFASTLNRINDEPIENVDALFDISGFYITLKDDISTCISVKDNKLFTSPNCLVKFTVESSSIYPLYQYHESAWKLPHSFATHLDVDLSLPGRPLCHEFLQTSDKNKGLAGGQLDYFPETRIVRYNVKKLDGEVYTDETQMTLRTSDHSLHNFTVAVSNEPFDPSAEFNPHAFHICMHFPGGTRHGRDFQLDCHQPLTGRYLAIYMTNNNEKEKIRMTNLEVYANELYVPGVNELIVMTNSKESVNQTVFMQPLIMKNDNGDGTKEEGDQTYITKVTRMYEENKGLAYALGFGLGIGLLAVAGSILFKKKAPVVAPTGDLAEKHFTG